MDLNKKVREFVTRILARRFGIAGVSVFTVTETEVTGPGPDGTVTIRYSIAFSRKGLALQTTVNCSVERITFSHNHKTVVIHENGSTWVQPDFMEKYSRLYVQLGNVA